jgi:hypothetical protein
MPSFRRVCLPFALATGLCAVLSACGGGGDDSDPIDPFLATFVGYCHLEPQVSDTVTGAPLYGYKVITALSKSSANVALMQDTEYFFDASDCSGNLRATLSVSGPNTWLRIDGGEWVQGLAVDEVTVSEDDKLPGAGAGVAVTTSDGVTYAANFILGGVGEDIYYLYNNYLYDGDFSQPLDANGYPTALSQTPMAQRQ